MDEQLVLTAQTLRLNPDLHRAETPGDIFVVKNVPGRKYLTISTDQWNLLRTFANPSTVPEALRSVIVNRTCLPLREFYELVLKAHRAGVLQLTRQLEPDARATRWPLSLSPWIPLILTAASLVTAILLLALNPFPRPSGSVGQIVENLAVGWILLSVGLSLGQLLAASVLRHGGGEVYEPRFRLLRPVPYFGVNLGDASVTSRSTQAGVCCARLFPVIATAAALWYYRPEWGVLHVLGLLVMLRPFAEGCIPELISTLCRGLVLDTQKNLLFTPNRRWKVRMRISLSRLSFGYLFVRLVWGIAWIAFVLFVALRAARQDIRDVVGTIDYWQEVGLVFGSVAGAILLGYLATPAARVLWVRSRAKLQMIAQGWRRWRVRSTDVAGDEVIARVLSDSLLFRRIAPAERDELRRAGQLRFFKSRTTLLQFQDSATEVGVILSGKVLVYRRNKAGRPEKALTLSEGDVFGAHALLDAQRQHVRIKAITPVVALMIPKQEFESRVLRTLGAPLINDLVQKVPFLRQVSFCESWHPQAIARFAQLSSVVTFDEGELIVAERQDTQQFYIVYEGQVGVKRKGRLRSRLRPGSFFGEISILQNSAAISDVIAREPSRCLMISKADFLRFVTHNPFVSLQLEQISSKRLGRPIFPLSAHSFEIR